MPKTQNRRRGLIAAFFISVTAGVSLPMVNVLKMFTPAELLVVRGILTALIALIVTRGNVRITDRSTVGVALTMPLAALGLYEGSRAWGTIPTIILITATPVVNFLISVCAGKKVYLSTVAGLAAVIGGVIVAGWHTRFSAAGLGWSLFGAFFNGIMYEFLPRAKAEPYQRCFWACLGIGVVGMLFSLHASWTGLSQPLPLALLVLFAFVGGFLYWMSNVIAFDELPKDEASVLAQGETIAVIIGAILMAHEHLTALQLIGIIVAIGGVIHVGRSVPKNQEAVPR